jgi:AcrR family transcriptional regulator
MPARERLIEAAKELLWERGYEAMSPRAVQERSGAGQGSFYHHFAGKADLAVAALSEVEREMREALDASLHSDKPPLERVRDYLTQPREGLAGCRLGRMTQEQIVSREPLSQPIHSYFLYAEQELTAVLLQARQEGALSEALDVKAIAATLLAIVQGGYVLSRALQDSQQMELAVQGALALLADIERHSYKGENHATCTH